MEPNPWNNVALFFVAKSLASEKFLLEELIRDTWKSTVLLITSEYISKISKCLWTYDIEIFFFHLANLASLDPFKEKVNKHKGIEDYAKVSKANSLYI